MSIELEVGKLQGKVELFAQLFESLRRDFLELKIQSRDAELTANRALEIIQQAIAAGQEGGGGFEGTAEVPSGSLSIRGGLSRSGVAQTNNGIVGGEGDDES